MRTLILLTQCQISLSTEKFWHIKSILRGIILHRYPSCEQDVCSKYAKSVPAWADVPHKRWNAVLTFHCPKVNWSTTLSSSYTKRQDGVSKKYCTQLAKLLGNGSASQSTNILLKSLFYHAAFCYLWTCQELSGHHFVSIWSLPPDWSSWCFKMRDHVSKLGFTIGVLHSWSSCWLPLSTMLSIWQEASSGR